LKPIVSISCFFLFAVAFPKESVTVDSVFFYPTSVSIDEAKKESLNRCRKIAVEKVVPKKTLIAGNAILEKMESDGQYRENAAFTSFHTSTSVGYIIEEKILASNPQSFTDNGFNYHISYTAAVEIPQGERDPGMSLELWSQSKSLNDGEALFLYAKSSMNGFVYIFHFMPDQSVEMLFPNQYLPDNQLVKNEPEKFPKNENVKIRLTSLPGQPITTETFYAIFCKSEIPEMKIIVQISENEGRLSAGDESFQQFQSLLAQIPLSLRTEAAVQVLVIARDD